MYYIIQYTLNVHTVSGDDLRFYCILYVCSQFSNVKLKFPCELSTTS